MLARIVALARLMLEVGPIIQVADQINIYVRFRVLEALDEAGLFAFIAAQPRSYEALLAEFDFRDTPYTRDVFAALSGDEGVLILEDDCYTLDPQRPVPKWDDMRHLPPVVLDFEAFKTFAPLVLERMRGGHSPLARRLTEERDTLLAFDETLTNRLYKGLRIAAHTWARPYMTDLTGKRLLEVGCGPGIETAHLWLMLRGKVKITAIDPVQTFVDLSESRFREMVNQMSGGRAPEVTPANMPVFLKMSAEELAFPDMYFDMVFHSSMLHWTSNPRQAVREMLRVLRVGGVIYGSAGYKPRTSEFLDLIIRISPDVHGFYEQQELYDWYETGGAPFEDLTSGTHRARKTHHVWG